MTNANLIAKLKLLDACDEAIQWLGTRDSEAMYKDCGRGDWLLWLATKIDYDEKTLQFIYCAIARTVLPNYEKAFPGDRRPHEAIEMKERRLKGEVTNEQLSTALSAARSAAWSAESAARSAARSAPLSAAWSAESAAWSAESAARSAVLSAAWSAAWSAARSAESAVWSAESAARSAVLSAAWSAESAARSEQANIFRSFITLEEIEQRLNA